jgi:hypothetical protein
MTRYEIDLTPDYLIWLTCNTEKVSIECVICIVALEYIVYSSIRGNTYNYEKGTVT